MAEATPHGPAPHILLPKMHQDRCVLALADLHVKRSVRKRAKRFRVSSGACFDRVLQGCLAQHGENWLYPPIVELFQRLFCSGGAGGVRMHSFEVWDEDGALVAGEVGYSVGGCYTSASGFSTVDNAGSVQCVATALLLEQAGASFWDLGMALPYKLAMGCALHTSLAPASHKRTDADLRCQHELAMPSPRHPEHPLTPRTNAAGRTACRDQTSSRCCTARARARRSRTPSPRTPFPARPWSAPGEPPAATRRPRPRRP
jgi:Leu/Phe-tRNA-protein transferase